MEAAGRAASRRFEATGVDLEAAARAIEDLLAALGQDPDDEALARTPRQAAAALAAFVTPEPFVMTTFANDGGYDEMVVVRDLAFRALCVHDLQPVGGVVHVAYLPGPRLVGLSKFGRLVDRHASVLQSQERLTRSVADAVTEALRPRGVGVVVEVDHDCTGAPRAVHGPRAVTTELRGVLRDDAAARSEFLELVRGVRRSEARAAR